MDEFVRTHSNGTAFAGSYVTAQIEDGVLDVSAGPRSADTIRLCELASTYLYDWPGEASVPIHVQDDRGTVIATRIGTAGTCTLGA